MSSAQYLEDIDSTLIQLGNLKVKTYNANNPDKNTFHTYETPVTYGEDESPLLVVFENLYCPFGVSPNDAMNKSRGGSMQFFIDKEVSRHVLERIETPIFQRARDAKLALPFGFPSKEVGLIQPGKPKKDGAGFWPDKIRFDVTLELDRQTKCPRVVMDTRNEPVYVLDRRVNQVYYSNAPTPYPRHNFAKARFHYIYVLIERVTYSSMHGVRIKGRVRQLQVLEEDQAMLKPPLKRQKLTPRQ